MRQFAASRRRRMACYDFSAMTKSLDFRTIGTLLVLRENLHAPTEDDWNAFLRELHGLRPRMKEMRAIVFTDGGGPTTDQRKRLRDVIEGHPIHTAVVTDKVTVRFIISSIALFNKTIRTFSWKEVGDAYSWLGLGAADQRLIERALDEMGRTVQTLRAPTAKVG